MKNIATALGIILVSSLGIGTFSPLTCAAGDTIPYYFFVIHNEPHNVNNGTSVIQQDYARLQKMVTKADEYNIKLTIMFSAQWADYVIKNNKLAEVKSWAKNGHEIAAHHHTESHGNWDGYSNMPYATVKKYRKDKEISKEESYLGKLNAFVTSLQRLNPQLNSGCLNDEKDKTVMMNEIIYDTCSGFANSGTVGSRSGDMSVDKGLNKYITTGTVNGIKRKWLGHHMVNTSERESSAEEAFKTLDADSVYGAIIHSMESEYDYYVKYLEFLHQQDPSGASSRTISKVIEQKMLPEQEIPSDLLLKKYE